MGEPNVLPSRRVAPSGTDARCVPRRLTAPPPLLPKALPPPPKSMFAEVRDRERELDSLDRDIDDLVTTTITQVAGEEARMLLACMKFGISLERIGDLLLSFVNRAEAGGRQHGPRRSPRPDGDDLAVGTNARLTSKPPFAPARWTRR